VVVGHGVQQLLLPYLIVLLFLGAALLLAYYVVTRPRIRDKPMRVRIIAFLLINPVCKFLRTKVE
jgi:hypothetical protein